MQAFCASLRDGGAAGMDFGGIRAVTAACLAALDSMADGEVKTV
jgi:hypothetical protein